MALAKIHVEIYVSLEIFRCYAHILNEYAKEKEKEEKEKNTTKWPTFPGILLKINSEYLFSNSLIQLVIGSCSYNARCFFIR